MLQFLGLGRKTLYRIGLIILIAGAVWMKALVSFVDKLPMPPAEDDATVTDAIVMLTGGSDRLSVALNLLHKGMANRLFITGVGEDTNLENILVLSGKPLPDDIAELMPFIELGYDAENTKGNAMETKVWVEKNHIRSIRLVTANYHMPRSLVEFHHMLPGVTIVPHPIIPEGVSFDHWWKKAWMRRLMMAEFGKYLASRFRSYFAEEESAPTTEAEPHEPAAALEE